MEFEPVLLASRKPFKYKEIALVYLAGEGSASSFSCLIVGFAAYALILFVPGWGLDVS